MNFSCQEVTQARQKTDSRLNHSTLATRVSEETLLTKKILTTADIIAKNLIGLRTGVLEFAKEMEISDRNWAKRMVTIDFFHFSLQFVFTFIVLYLKN